MYAAMALPLCQRIYLVALARLLLQPSGIMPWSPWRWYSALNFACTASHPPLPMKPFTLAQHQTFQARLAESACYPWYKSRQHTAQTSKQHRHARTWLNGRDYLYTIVKPDATSCAKQIQTSSYSCVPDHALHFLPIRYSLPISVLHAECNTSQARQP